MTMRFQPETWYQRAIGRLPARLSRLDAAAVARIYAPGYDHAV